MHCAGSAARFFGFRFTQTLSLSLQFSRKAMTLLRIFLKKGFELRIFHCVSSFLEPLLAILQGLDQIVDRRNNFFLLCHSTIISQRARVSVLRKFSAVRLRHPPMPLA